MKIHYQIWPPYSYALCGFPWPWRKVSLDWKKVNCDDCRYLKKRIAAEAVTEILKPLGYV